MLPINENCAKKPLFYGRSTGEEATSSREKDFYFSVDGDVYLAGQISGESSFKNEIGEAAALGSSLISAVFKRHFYWQRPTRQ